MQNLAKIINDVENMSDKEIENRLDKAIKNRGQNDGDIIPVLPNYLKDYKGHMVFIKGFLKGKYFNECFEEYVHKDEVLQFLADRELTVCYLRETREILPDFDLEVHVEDYVVSYMYEDAEERCDFQDREFKNLNNKINEWIHKQINYCYTWTDTNLDLNKEDLKEIKRLKEEIL